MFVIVPAFRVLAGAFPTWLYVGLGLFVFSAILCAIQYVLESIFGAINWAAIFNPVVFLILLVVTITAFFKWARWLEKRDAARFPALRPIVFK